MAGFLGYVVAGAGMGLGKGMVAEANAKREAAMKELEYERQIARDESDRSFRSQENQKQRDFSAGESALTRQQAAALAGSDVYGADGTMGRTNPMTRTIENYQQDGQNATGWRAARTDGGSSLSAAQSRVAISEVDKAFNSNFDIEAAIGDLEVRGVDETAIVKWARNKLLAEGRQQKEPDPARYADARLRELGLVDGGGAEAPVSAPIAPTTQRDQKAPDGGIGASVGRAGGAMLQENAPSGTARQPVQIRDRAAYDALPSGSQYIDPNGTVRTKP
jgi:hypothetical protein